MKKVKKRKLRAKADREDFRKQPKKVCRFCRQRIVIDYKNVGLLKRYLSEKNKIRARRISGNCARHQREVARAIKRARELALLSYTR